MRIKWRGHASFLIELAGKELVTDPFDEELGYPLSPLTADIVTISHDHWDHNAPETIQGNPLIVKGSGVTEIDGITLRGVDSWHDAKEGRKRGPNTIFKISAEGIDLVHLGDLGHLLSAGQEEDIGAVDILLIPVGGEFTIDADQAVEVAARLQPKIVIPMHYATPHLSFELAPLEKFTAHYDQVVKKPCLEVNPGDWGTATKIVVLDYLCS